MNSVVDDFYSDPSVNTRCSLEGSELSRRLSQLSSVLEITVIDYRENGAEKCSRQESFLIKPISFQAKVSTGSS